MSKITKEILKGLYRFKSARLLNLDTREMAIPYSTTRKTLRAIESTVTNTSLCKAIRTRLRGKRISRAYVYKAILLQSLG